MILTRTPLRVSLFGGGTDYPAWFNGHGGAVLGMAIDKYTYVGVKRMPPGQEISPGVPLRFRVQYSKVDDCIRADQIKHPAVRAALAFYGLEQEALEFHCFGDLPGRSGLGGSSAFTVGLCHALHRLFRFGMEGAPFDAWRIADEAIRIEQEEIKEAVGCQDQVLCAHGGMNLVTFEHKCRVIRPLDIPSERLEELAYSLVLVFSGSMRDAHVMAAKQIEAIPQRTAVLERMKKQAWTAYDLLINGGRLSTIGGMLNEAWELKKSITPEITSPQIDKLYETGLKCGATGGKLLGAGGGGFFLFFVPVGSRDTFETEISAAGYEYAPFHISREGSRAIVLEDE